MHKLIPTLTLAGSLALATLCEADTRKCTELLGPMTGIMQSLRLGAPLTPGEQQAWRTWNTVCKDRSWQDQLAQTLPGGPPRPMVLDTPTYTPPEEPTLSLTWRDYVLAALQGFERGLNAPRTLCRTERAQRGNRVGYYTTCNTYGGY